MSGKLVAFYIKLGSSAERFAFIRDHSFFRELIKNGCPEMSWTHCVPRGRNSVIDGNGTLCERIQDMLIHTQGTEWSLTRNFIAGERRWIVSYHKNKAADARMFSAQTGGAGGTPERVILWYATGSKLAHNNAKYDEKLRLGIADFSRQLG